MNRPIGILPFGDWLAASIIALVTLRKGLKTDGLLLVAALAYMSCYLAAGALYLSQSWRIVCGMIFLQALLGGWSEYEMVLRYAHLSSDHLKTAAERITMFNLGVMSIDQPISQFLIC